MNTYEKAVIPIGYDAAGRPITSWGVVWTATDIKGMFIAAVTRGEPPSAEIVEYYWHQPEMGLSAFIKNKITNKVILYGMDVDTRRPYPIWPPKGEPPPRRKRRPRMSREWKLWHAKRRWEER